MQRFRAFNSIAARVCKVPTRNIVVNAASNSIATDAHPLYTAKQAMEKVTTEGLLYLYHCQEIYNI